jgi:tRNA threonylcarbamoyladenosine biosynthesis protein TsaB
MDYTLAIEASTTTPSTALLRGDDVLGEASWLAARGATQRMFEAMQSLLESHNVTPEAIDLFAVGLGPGGFTGMRLALSALQALALPTKQNVMGISSAEAVAAQVQRDLTPTGRTIVVGDARRKRLWAGVFCSTEGALKQDGDFSLVPISDFPKTLRDGDVVASPDRVRLGDELREVVTAPATLIDADVIPTAADIAHLARQRVADGVASEALEPIYMHPPVFVEPRFSPRTVPPTTLCRG